MNIPKEILQIKKPQKESHKGQNGRLLIIGGSKLFHAASLWSLTVASRIVDLVHYSSTPENNAIVHDLKTEFRDGIIVPREEVDAYIEEDDCILIGPGMVRTEGVQAESGRRKAESLKDIEKIEDEGMQTAVLTNYLLAKYPKKQWVIDAGALQMMEPSLTPQHAILTPHRREFEQLKLSVKRKALSVKFETLELKEQVKLFAQEFNCIVLVKGEVDIVSDGSRIMEIAGGNAGMTKGGTGDVLAGLIAGLSCMNDPWVATVAGSYINKAAGDSLFKKVGVYFNASDLASEIPKVMNQLLG